jgi:hypothetical protein
MKNTLFLFQFLLAIMPLYSQSVSIELSVSWRLEKNILEEGSIMNTPILNIIYRNNSSDNIYFKKISMPDYNELPKTSSGALVQISDKELANIDWQGIVQSAISYSKFTVGRNYLVEIGNSNTIEGYWNVINYEDTCIECESDYINDVISDVHRYINFRNKLRATSIKSKLQFIKSDIIEDSVLHPNKKYFVFLKPKEIHIDSFNVFAFNLVKGNFTFSIGKNVIENYDFIKPFWDENQKLWIQRVSKLPERVGVYKLYSGGINTNKLTIEFR